MPAFGDHSSMNNWLSDISSEMALFGKYEVGKLLGHGAFAKVYQARNVKTGETVAIKAVSKRKVLRGKLMAQVKMEIAIMHRLNHPNIVKLVEVLATKTKVYFVMEYAKGGELSSRIKKGRFSEDLSRRYFQKLISAVGFCHLRGVYHRDLKPENLLLDENWNLKVTDFGLSAVSEQVRQDGLLHTLCGTPAYVAPEILAKRGYDGAKVDIWACGIILFFLHAGYLPFDDSNMTMMYRKIYRGEFKFPKWTSPELQRLISHLLDTNPETRITIDEIMNDPWFKDGFKEVKVHPFFDFEMKEETQSNIRLNAFDLISFSSGFDLSGLFNDVDFPVQQERFISAEKPWKIIDRIRDEVDKIMNVEVISMTDSGIRLEHQCSNLVITIDVHQLTEKLVVVVVNRRELNAGSSDELWNDKLKPRLFDLVYNSGSDAKQESE
ncbi:CBL-interacting serine/threonine-protein kinase 19 [Hibiscus syriacus]|uniref:non-specific serine/threonine protein kinase n=1 Tax=Hibiscus syriacus TaxID=106335 RepID=A0A6A2XXD9_HIBSY|nr:CBL-interacting serine/threonine-protein kinase 14-like [Hibiscus syriacus]KAE8663199.1 CBL-interacting serine/threonine-protein kinase 19 [Hibiscus syriacus]